MRKKLSVLIALILMVICCACTDSSTSISRDSSFSITFIDVGQGDSALVECDGRYMLIDGGEVQAGNKVYQVLEERGVDKLDILAMSHLHSDHIGGLIKALTYAQSIGITISNANESKSDIFKKVEYQLGIDETEITVPHVGDKYQLGSAWVEVIDVASSDANDSLVLLITYGDTRFLFTGDIEYQGQKRICDKYMNEPNQEFKVDLIKMPHHGSYENGDITRLLSTFMPDYAIISCGEGNSYGHPHRETLEALDNKAFKAKVYRTDKDGDITVKSDGKKLSVQTSK